MKSIVKSHRSPSLLTRRYAFFLAEGSPSCSLKAAAATILISSSLSTFSTQDGSLYRTMRLREFGSKPHNNEKLWENYRDASSSSCIRRTQNIETELYKPQPIGFSDPSATRTTSPVIGGGLPIILSMAPLYTIGLPSLNS